MSVLLMQRSGSTAGRFAQSTAYGAARAPDGSSARARARGAAAEAAQSASASASSNAAGAAPPARRYERSTSGLRDMLFDTIDDVRAGRIKASEASQIASVAKTIVMTADLELRVQRQAKDMGGETDAIRMLPPVVVLGKDHGGADE